MSCRVNLMTFMFINNVYFVGGADKENNILKFGPQYFLQIRGNR